jgi:hypothetical protein
MRKVPGAVRRTTQALGVAASAGLVLATLGATAANAFPMETGASECTTGTVVGDHVVYQAPPGKYVRDNMTLTEAASAAREAKFQAQLAKMVAAGVEGKKTTKIPVSFHVIRSGTAESQGNLPQAKIDAQIAQMNKAYAGNESGPGVKTGFKFVLKNVTRTTNSTWYNGADPQSQIERQMKTALHEGD